MVENTCQPSRKSRKLMYCVVQVTSEVSENEKLAYVVETSPEGTERRRRAELVSEYTGQEQEIDEVSYSTTEQSKSADEADDDPITSWLHV